MDADVLMNLAASGRAEEILAALRLTLVMPPTVATEAIYIEGREPGAGREAIDLAPLRAAGLVAVTSIDVSELALVIELAATVDDGEAEAIAVASTRQIPLATDDRKARRVAAERSVALSSTPDLLHDWHIAAEIAAVDMRAVLVAIERGSHYRPPRDHALFDWWRDAIGSEAGQDSSSDGTRREAPEKEG